MKTDIDFFLTTAGELEGLAAPRACRVLGRLKDQIRDDHMLIEIEPPLIGQDYGLGSRDILNLLISARHERVSLFPITEWPGHVHVSRILDETPMRTLFFTTEQIEVIAWGTIFRTREEALAHAKRFERSHH